MCGIAGYFNLSNTQFALDDALLEKLQQTLSHRGPDGYAVWKSTPHQIAFIHRRLSIIDLSAAATQPMLDKEKTVAITYNGEIYNHSALRKELELLGYHYFSNSDTETLLYAYKEWGISFLDRLEGMFSIALFDAQKNELYLIRDRMGVKPMYFSVQGGILSFASEIKALWQLPWNQKKINQHSVYHYLTFLTTPAPSTLYHQIYKLPAAFYAKIDAHKELTFHEWYTPIKQISEKEKQQFEAEQFCIDGIRSLLSSAVKKRMMSDVPFGAFLSGGVDSSLNVALMAECVDKVKTFNVAFSDGPEFDEMLWARKVAKLFNTEHYEIVISEKEAFEFFQKMIYHQDEPLADCVGAPLYHVAKLLKNTGVSVVLSGEGADELFCGYSDYARYINLYHRFWQPSQKYIPAFAKHSIYSLASSVLNTRINRLDLIKNWCENKYLFWTGAMAFSELWKQQLILPHESSLEHDPIIEKVYTGLNLESSSYAVVEYHLQKLKNLSPNADFLTNMIYLELKNRLPELLLMRADKMTMAASVEGRVPYLDHALVEFSLHIPSRFKYKNGITKYILKRAAEGIIPDEIIYRKKMGFASPISRWPKHGTYFKPYIQDALATQSNEWHKHLDIKKINSMFLDNQHTQRDYSVQLWTLQNVMSYDGL